MALDSRIIGEKVAAAIRNRFKKARPFWTEIFDQLFEHIRIYMDLVEVINLFKTSSTSYTIPDEDAFVMVETIPLGGPYNIFLPNNPFEGQYVVIKDAGGAADVGNEIIINRNGELIDNASVNDVIDTGYGNATYVYEGTSWMRLQEGAGGGGGGGSGTAPTIEYFDVTSSSDTVHDLAATPSGAVRVYLNGQLCREGGTDDFTVVGDDINMVRDVRAGDVIAVVYYT